MIVLIQEERMLRILHVDTDTPRRLWYARALTLAGYDVDSWTSIDEADGAHLMLKFDIIICEDDIEERGEGFDYLSLLRASNVRTPIILHTQKCETDIAGNLADLQIVYLKKREPSRLVETVNTILATRERQAA